MEFGSDTKWVGPEDVDKDLMVVEPMSTYIWVCSSAVKMTSQDTVRGI